MKYLVSILFFALLFLPFFKFGHAQFLKNGTTTFKTIIATSTYKTINDQIKAGQNNLNNLIKNAKVQPLPPIEINVGMTPKRPGPNRLVYVSLTSYGTDLDSALIEYKVNAKIEKAGVGIKNFKFTTGDMGTLTTFQITVTTSVGEVITKIIKIKPATVDLLWQSNSYVPPFYSGKASFSYQNRITFIAVPHILLNGVEIPPKNLIYKWTKNDSVIPDASGYGKDTYSFTDPLISRGATIGVEATSINTDDVATANASVEPGDPFIVFYEKNPLYGIMFQKALHDTVNLKDSKEISIVAMPFFFGTTKAMSNLSYDWSINNKSIGDNLSTQERVFRQKEGVKGTSRISLNIDHLYKILQSSSFGFNLKF